MKTKSWEKEFKILISNSFSDDADKSFEKYVFNWVKKLLINEKRRWRKELKKKERGGGE